VLLGRPQSGLSAEDETGSQAGLALVGEPQHDTDPSPDQINRKRMLGGSASHRMPTRSVLTAIAALCALAIVVTAYLAYGRLNNRLDALQVTAAGNKRVQADERRELRDLKVGQNQLADQVATTQNKLNEHPAASKVAKQAQPSVFTVLAGDWLGSGFVVSSGAGSSKLLTNYHVVEEVYANGGRQVKLRRGDTTYDGNIVDVSQADDLAVIEVNQVLPALELAPSRAAIGDPLLVLGSPNGLAGTLTSGIVSSYRTLEHVSYLQLSAPISPGNSGGPVLNETGQVLGVTVMKDVRDGSEGIGYAIPTDRVCESLDVC
jgi:S1-C subfamily serine protease